MNLNDLSVYAISRSFWERVFRDCRLYTDTVAARVDVNKALSRAESFSDAAVKMWFSIGYLEELVGDGLPEVNVRKLLTEDEFNRLRDLLLWLKPLHDNAVDVAIVDSKNVLNAFYAYRKIAFEGKQFLAELHGVGDGTVSFSDLFDDPDLLNKAHVEAEILRAKDEIFDVARFLGYLHRVGQVQSEKTSQGFFAQPMN